MKVATWNINSVRLRINSVIRFLEEAAPDVLCLQETKCPEDKFPAKAFVKAGYEHHAVSGQDGAKGGYNGVAIVSRVPLKDIEKRRFCDRDDARHVAATVSGGVRVHNFYVPAGGDEPDPSTNEKFDHKLNFLTEMKDAFPKSGRSKAILVGDLNVAPGEHDVWSHKQLLKVVSHTPVETALLDEVLAASKWIDVARLAVPADEKLFTWWSYRSRDWRASNRGRRLDHIWITPALKKAVEEIGPDGYCIHSDCRDWEKPSDHAPVTLQLAL